MPELLQQYLVFLVLTFLLCSTANTLIWRSFSSEVRGILDWLMLFFLVVAGLTLLILGTIGFMGHFNVAAQIAATLVVFGFGGLRLPFLGRHFQIGSLEAWNKLRHLIFRQQTQAHSEWVYALFGFLILFGAVELFNAFVQYPWEYDSLAYHLPIVIEWVKSESLWNIFYAAWGGPLGYYPSHHELLLSWLVLPFGNDYLVNVMNFLVLGVMVVAVYKILIELGLKEFLAWLGSALVMMMPVFLGQLGTSQVDVLLALGVLLSWYYLLRTHKRQDGQLLMPVSLSMALVLGTKYLGLFYGLPIFLVFLCLVRQWSKQSRWWWFLALIVLSELGCMWYWRNLLLTGNPVFPADLQIGETVIFQGYHGLMERIQGLSLWERVTASGEWWDWLSAMQKQTGWYLYLVVVAYAVLVVEVLAKLFFSQFEKGSGKLYTLILLFFPIYWYLYFITPYTASMMTDNIRYAMPWLLLAVVLVIYVLQKLKSSRHIVLVVLLGVLWWQFFLLMSSPRLGSQMFLQLSFVKQFPGLFLLFLVSFALAWASCVGWGQRQWWRFIGIFVAIGVSFVFLQQSAFVRSQTRAESWQQKYPFELIQVYKWIDEKLPADATIANTLNSLYYPLYGKSWQRTVRYVNINDCFDCGYSGYQQLELQLRDNPSYEAWLSNLRQQGTQYLVIGYADKRGLEQVIPYELQWTQEHPQQFELVFQVGEARVYKLKNL